MFVFVDEVGEKFMCGICGFSGKPDKSILSRMNARMFHRGPDEDGIFQDEKMSLGMRRLAIVDIEGGHQPICNEDGTIWTVFNGEIYNYPQLREQLEERNHRFRTHHSDTEVVVHLYEEYGVDWPLHVNGMFGAAIWDVSRSQLALFRDRIGKKPVYYAIRDGNIIFASEIKALFQHPAISRKIDFKALYHYFYLKNISAPDTAFDEIKQLLPGCALIWEDGDLETHCYWKIDFSYTDESISEAEAGHMLLKLLEDAVRIRMRSDAPYGAYLSGGIDSSAVVALMSRHAGRPVKTFCLGYVDPAEGQFVGKTQDIVYARQMSRSFETEHHEWIIGAEDFARQAQDAICTFDEPFSGTVSTFFLSQLIKRHVKVALSGDGADELFGSYLAHRLAFPIAAYLELRAQGKADWNRLGNEDRFRLAPFDSPDQFAFLVKVADQSVATWRDRIGVFDRGERHRLLSREFLDAAGCAYGPSVYERIEQCLTARDSLNRALETDQLELLPNQILTFIDRLSMAHSIEVRSPYLDYRIIEFVNRLPGHFKIKNGLAKYIHKRSLRGVLPIDLIDRPKEGFVQPIYSWMHGSLKQWTLCAIAELPTRLFNVSYLKKLTQAFAGGDQSVNAKIWNLVCFSFWWQEYGN